MYLTVADRRQTSPRRSRPVALQDIPSGLSDGRRGQAPKLQQTSAYGDAPMTRHLPASNGSGVADGSLSGAYDGPPLAHGGWARVAVSKRHYLLWQTRDDEARRPRPPPRNGGQGPQYPMPRWRAANSSGVSQGEILGKQLLFVACGGSIEKDKNGAPHSTLPPRCGIIGSWTDAPWNGSATTS